MNICMEYFLNDGSAFLQFFFMSFVLFVGFFFFPQNDLYFVLSLNVCIE